ncbi:MAG: response regulator [Elusimicrobiales bacterium]|nr:response regulator [Elusimicrobiales bacterium]
MALILIIDDDNNFRELLAAAVSEMGHDVLTAADGAAGLESAKTYLPHIIISDIMMPEMDGVELNTHLQLTENTKGIPVLMLTGNLDKHMEVSTRFAAEMSFEYIVSKSAPLEQITGIVKEMLSRYYQL